MAIVPLRYIEYGVYGDLIIRYPKPYSIYLRGTMRSSGTIRESRTATCHDKICSWK